MSEAFTLDILTKAMDAVKSENRIHPLILDGRQVYLMTISPEARRIMVMIKAKARWKEQHREARIARRMENDR
jgi:hypothetical protein